VKIKPIQKSELKATLRVSRRAVIDIGSNSVRLVIYDGPQRAPIQICNEKVLCGLGRGLGKGGILNPRSVESAMTTLRRFKTILSAHNNPPTRIFATAAVRSAKDGKVFVKSVRAIGFNIDILSGEEEAQYAALGVVSYNRYASGIVGDMGGGSLELTRLDDGVVGKKVSLSIGPLRLMEETKSDLKASEKIIDRELKSVEWLKEKKVQRLYAVGGAWRAIAKIHMSQRSYPMEVLHQYKMSAKETRDICQLIEKQSVKSLSSMKDIPKRRLDTLPFAALALDRLLTRLKIEEVVISVGGLREGILYDDLDNRIRKHDPLIALGRYFAKKFSPEPEFGYKVIPFTEKLFSSDAPERKRLRWMISLMVDIGAYIHPNFRGRHAFNMSMCLPIIGLSHHERVMAALALLRRYDGHRGNVPNQDAVDLLSVEERDYATKLGLALRFAADFSPKTTNPMKDCEIYEKGDYLVLSIPENHDDTIGELPRRRFQSLADMMGKDVKIVTIK